MGERNDAYKIRVRSNYSIVVASPQSDNAFFHDVLFLPEEKFEEHCSKMYLESYKHVILTKTKGFDLRTCKDEYTILLPFIEDKGINVQKAILETSILAYEGFYHKNLNCFLYKDVRREIISDVQSFYDECKSDCIYDPREGLICIKEKLSQKTITFCLEDFLKSGITNDYSLVNLENYGPSIVSTFNQNQNEQYMSKFYSQEIKDEFLKLRKNVLLKFIQKLNVDITDIDPNQKNYDRLHISILRFLESSPFDVRLLGFKYLFEQDLKSPAFYAEIASYNYYLLFSKLRTIEIKLDKYY